MLKKPMKKPGIAINSARCMACYACFMACKDEHCGWDTALTKSQPELGQYWMNIVEWERGDCERRIKTATVPTPCSHCDNPACMAAAKDGAVQLLLLLCGRPISLETYPLYVRAAQLQRAALTVYICTGFTASFLEEHALKE